MYSEFFLYYDDAPLLIVNASEIDLANSERITGTWWTTCWIFAVVATISIPRFSDSVLPAGSAMMRMNQTGH